MTIASLILGCSLMIGVLDANTAPFMASERRSIVTFSSELSLWRSRWGAHMNVTHPGKVCILTCYPDPSNDELAWQQMDVKDQGRWVQYQRTCSISDCMKGTMADGQYYLYQVTAKADPAASSRGTIRRLMLYRADDGFPSGQPARAIPFPSSRMSSTEDTLDGGYRYELVPVDMAADRMLLLGLTEEYERGLKPFVDIFLTLGHVPPASTLFSLLVDNGELKGCRLRPGSIRTHQNDGTPHWARQDDRIHVIWERTHIGVLYSSIDLRSHRWEKPIVLDTVPGTLGSSIAVCGGSIYACMWNDVDFHCDRDDPSSLLDAPGCVRNDDRLLL